VRSSLFFTPFFICLTLIFHSPLSWSLEKKEQKTLPIEELQRFSTVLDTVHQSYVEPKTDAALFDSAIKGMMTDLDPHSSYLTPEEFTELRSMTNGHFGGLGIEITPEEGLIRVITPIDDSPAQKAGIKSGDLIIRIKDTPVKGLSLNKAVEMMRGEPGSSIKITVFRKDVDKALSFTLKRELIRVASVRTKPLEPAYGYIRIAQFQSQTSQDLNKTLKELMNKAPQHALKGLILDLRNNPGGMLDAAVHVSNTFLDAKKLKHNNLIVYTKGRLPQTTLEEKAHGDDQLKKAPLIVLINSGSASAAEIVAGALQDHKRALIMGEQSFGKGSVQSVLPLQNGYGLKLTTALYYTPAGHSIQAHGIVPDLLVSQEKRTSPINNNDNAFGTIREADLAKHLEQPNNKKKADKIIKEETAQKEEWYQQDYQLLQALHVLKGLSLYQRPA
jgi:carboxyl-terminal processing protease